MRILFVGTLTPNPGGSGALNGHVLGGLAALGHRCRAVAPRTPDPVVSHGSAYAELREVQVRRYHIPNYMPCQDAIFRAPGYRALECAAIQPLVVAAIREERPDVVLVGRESFLAPVLPLVASLAIPILVISHHGNLPGNLLGGSHPQSFAHELIEQLRSVQCLVAVAEHLAADWRRLGLTNVRAIPNAVDIDQFAPRKRGSDLQRALDLAHDDVVVLHASSFKPVKRIGDLIDAAAIASQSNGRLRYVLLGDGEEYATMVDACARRGLTGRFRFPGWVRRGQVVDYLNLADMLVLPSESEAMSLAVLEAQACGKLVLASDIPASRELIRDGETGLLFPVGDVAGLAAAMLRAANDPRLCARIGAAAHREAQGRTLKGMIDRYAAALEGIVQAG